MNANELADELEKGGGHYMLNIASMLRQQANRIAKLEEELKEEKEHSAILEKDRDFFLAENDVWKKYFEAFHKVCESNNKQRQIIFNRNAEIKKLQAEIEALKKKIQNMALDLLSAHAQADDHWVELERLRKAQEK